MPEATLTFEIGGRVELKDLSEGITLFERLVSSLTPRAGVAWVVEDLRAGSATATLRGEANSPAVLERVIADYEEIGRCLSLNRTPIHDSGRAVKAARDIAAFANRLEYVRFETPSQDYLIYGNGSADADIPTSPLVSVGRDNRKGSDPEQPLRVEVHHVRRRSRQGGRVLPRAGSGRHDARGLGQGAPRSPEEYRETPRPAFLCPCAT